MLSDYEHENQEHRETCSSDIEQTQPPAEDDFSPDVKVTSLTFDPMRSKADGGTSEIEKISAKFCA